MFSDCVSCYQDAVISRYKDTQYKDMLDVRAMQLETKHCILTTVALLSKDTSM